MASPTMADGGKGAAPHHGGAAAADGEDLVVLERIRGNVGRIATSILGEGPDSAEPPLNPGANDIHPHIGGTVKLQVLPIRSPPERAVGVMTPTQRMTKHL